jgi:hypothetical protein
MGYPASEDYPKLEIKFSHQYAKLDDLRDGDKVILSRMSEVKLGELPEVFKAWDTLYFEDGEEKHYALPPKGNYLLLVFEADHPLKGEHFAFFNHKLREFTTIRRWTLNKFGLNKFRYYKHNLGKEFTLRVA